MGGVTVRDVDVSHVMSRFEIGWSVRNGMDGYGMAQYGTARSGQTDKEMGFYLVSAFDGANDNHIYLSGIEFGRIKQGWVHILSEYQM